MTHRTHKMIWIIPTIWKSLNTSSQAEPLPLWCVCLNPTLGTQGFFFLSKKRVETCSFIVPKSKEQLFMFAFFIVDTLINIEISDICIKFRIINLLRERLQSKIVWSSALLVVHLKLVQHSLTVKQLFLFHVIIMKFTWSCNTFPLQDDNDLDVLTRNNDNCVWLVVFFFYFWLY